MNFTENGYLVKKILHYWKKGKNDRGKINVLTGSREWVTWVNRILWYQRRRIDSLDKIKSIDLLQKVSDLGDLGEQRILVLRHKERFTIEN